MRHDRSTPRATPAPAAPAGLGRRGMLRRGGPATAAGIGVLGVLDVQSPRAVTAGPVGVFSPFRTATGR